MSETWILVCNDDGIEAPGLLTLVSALQQRGWGVVVYAPSEECSAASMHLTLRTDIRYRCRSELLELMELDSDGIEPILYSIDGMPADCLILAIDGLLEANGHPLPRLCISGLNRGPNMSVDVLHSGTVAAAREAALYGLPAIASSLTTFDSVSFQGAAAATVSIVDAVFEWLPATPPALHRPASSRTPHNSSLDRDVTGSLRTAFLNGDMYLNLNIPPDWHGGWRTTRLGARWYEGAAHVEVESGICRIGAVRIIDDAIEDGESMATDAGFASITPLATWPQSHPLNIGDDRLSLARLSRDTGLPAWL